MNPIKLVAVFIFSDDAAVIKPQQSE